MFEIGIEIVRVGDVLKRLRHQLGLVVAEHALQRTVGSHPAPVERDQAHADRCVGEHALELLVRAVLTDQARARVRHVGHEADAVAHAAVAIAGENSFNIGGQRRAVRPQEVELALRVAVGLAPCRSAAAASL